MQWSNKPAINCMCACTYISLSFRTHVSKPIKHESSLYARNKGWTKAVFDLYFNTQTKMKSSPEALLEEFFKNNMIERL